ncbi:MAG: sulfurtransferase TusA family protein [Deltaproteobacteria bacterium]|nr:sulfurtransferase TusA family protein [Deltaproteobacteria bacterium]
MSDAENDIEVNKELDCRGLGCPMPILKTKKAIEELESGQVLKMTATEPGSTAVVKDWTSRSGNELLRHEAKNGEFTYFIRKK